VHAAQLLAELAGLALSDSERGEASRELDSLATTQQIASDGQVAP
jgi:hypothetical protein